MAYVFTPFSGYLTRRPTSTHKVSYWHIPMGSDYHNARVVECYFDDADSAQRFAAKYHNPPEMAVLIALNVKEPS